MSKILKLRRGTTEQTSVFTGAQGEITVDTTKWTVVVHDNVTPGGHALATENFVNNSVATTPPSINPPSDPRSGTLWYDSNSGRLYVYYSGSWVDASPSTGSVSVDNLQIVNTTISSINQNSSIYLSPNGSGRTYVNSELSVSGNIYGNVVGNVTGNLTGTATSAINASTATLATTATNAIRAGIITGADQPNITSLGTLTSLTVSGVITGNLTGNVTGNVSGSAGTATTATTAGTVTTATQPNITSVGTLGSLTVTANVAAGGVKTDHYYYANGTPFVSGSVTPPGSTPPGSATEGQLWFDTVTGRLFVRLGTTWVDTSLGTNVTTAPAHSTGQAGDVTGLIAYDSGYMYYCTGTYNGSTHIWKRVAWSGSTW